MDVCPRCKKLTNWSPYFQVYRCDHCGWQQTVGERVVEGLKGGPKTGPEIEDLLRDVPVSTAMSVMERLIWEGAVERGARQFHLVIT